ncbi:LPXTG cell wall anchor domain-containing protein [Shewanella avicenniae]|uniref:LPXTG cell wall anchor domain-containing protein n=1 Tax=Shewanella avicenniae TaxID=2814294 RepID=A0ABX7QVH5_9GAMM|nr:FimV/HubP family polar landmark protein [Shewanella avicenniae]QSX34975.1 LPXTG cell wall anchor domain-containing protein [Shewanella avicenniae]
MNFRTSYLVGLSAICLALSAYLSVPSAHSEVLKVTGPNGESRQQVRQYGPTSVNDTFWSIAQKVRPDDTVSIYQVMAAIFEANPQAFTSDNYNSLERGMILLIPSKEVMAAIPLNLARARAEQDDKSWNRKAAAPNPQPAAAKPVAATKPAPVAKPVEPAVDKVANQKMAELQQENDALKAEVAGLNTRLSESETQRQLLDTQNKALEERLSLFEEQLTATKLQLAQLQQELAAQTEAVKSTTPAEPAPTEPVATPEAETQTVEMPDDTWRSIDNNPLLLTAMIGLPALLLGLGGWLFMRRKRAAAIAATAAPLAASATAAAAMDEVDFVVDDDIKLEDAEVIHDSLDDLFDVDNIELQPEQELESDASQMDIAHEMFIDDGDDENAVHLDDEEGQSLDALWAEAIGEQSGEASGSAKADDDFESLLDGLDDEPSLSESLPDDVAAAFEHDFGGADDDVVRLDDDEAPADEFNGLDADELLAALEDNTDADDFDADALLAELEADTESATTTADSEDFDPDALLAELEADLPSAQTDIDDFDLADEIAAELEQDDDVEELDPDKLLAELAAEPQPEDLSDEIAAALDEESALVSTADELDPDALLAELEAEPIAEDLSDEIAAELADVDNSADELDADSLLAELDGASASADDLTDEIAAELSLEDDVSDFDELDTDALLAELESSAAVDSANTATDEIELEDELTVELTDDETLDSVDELDADALLAQLEQTAAEPDTATDDDTDDFDFSLEDEFDHPAEDENLDDLLAELSQAEERKSARAKDSGFFNDLKGPKSAGLDADELLESLDESAGLSLSDDDLLKQFSAEQPLVEEEESFELSLVDDEPDDVPRLTVDEALAALDSEELSKRPVKPVSESDLANFQKENGFIDIDRLLNDADESDDDGDLYKSLDVDVGDIDSLMSGADMVDVDDEENSVNAKLDLARAYIEIEDSDSAKALLQEVQADGNARQQEEAANLLKEIG